MMSGRDFYSTPAQGLRGSVHPADGAHENVGHTSYVVGDGVSVSIPMDDLHRKQQHFLNTTAGSAGMNDFITLDAQSAPLSSFSGDLQASLHTSHVLSPNESSSSGCAAITASASGGSSGAGSNSDPEMTAERMVWGDQTQTDIHDDVLSAPVSTPASAKGGTKGKGAVSAGAEVATKGGACEACHRGKKRCEWTPECTDRCVRCVKRNLQPCVPIEDGRKMGSKAHTSRLRDLKDTSRSKPSLLGSKKRTKAGPLTSPTTTQRREYTVTKPHKSAHRGVPGLRYPLGSDDDHSVSSGVGGGSPDGWNRSVVSATQSDYGRVMQPDWVEHLVSNSDVGTSVLQKCFLNVFDRHANKMFGVFPPKYMASLRQDRVLEEGIMAAAVSFGIRGSLDHMNTAQEVGLANRAVAISGNCAASGRGVTVHHARLELAIVATCQLDQGESQKRIVEHAARGLAYCKDLWDADEMVKTRRSESYYTLLSMCIMHATFLIMCGESVDFFFVDEAKRVLEEPPSVENGTVKMQVAVMTGDMSMGRIQHHIALIFSLAQIPTRLKSGVQSVTVKNTAVELTQSEILSLSGAIAESWSILQPMLDPVILITNRASALLFYHCLGDFESVRDAGNTIVTIWTSAGQNIAKEMLFLMKHRLLYCGCALYLNGEIGLLQLLGGCLRQCEEKAEAEAEVFDVWIDRLMNATQT
eukprot:GFYU01003917.1.p1 GENE.GFYU01003917.1~~GFYU01003917.1.p1  ORF type:complete len:697 (-),score=130.09 GFYU01003917.1:58-2148(-)